MDFHWIYFYLSLVLFVVYVFFKWKFSYWRNRGVPTLPPSIPYGNFKGINQTIHLKELINRIYSDFKNQSPVAGVYVLFRPIAIVTDLDLARDVLIKDFSIFKDRGLYYNEKDDPLSANMFSLDGHKWKSIRHRLSPTFTSGKMKFMFSTVVEVADRFIETVSSEIKVDPILEIKELLARFTTDVIGECAFGIDCNSLKDPNTEFRKYGRAVFQAPRHSRFTMSMISQFRGIAKKLGVKTVREDVSKFFMGVVRDTVAYREKNNIRRNDFMDLLIDMKNGKGDEELGSVTFEEIAAQAFVFYLAGFETSSTTLSYTLYELALNEDIQEKARNEVVKILKQHDGKLTYEAMMDMHYIDRITSESLRKYPPGIALQRKAYEDYTVPKSKILIEKGTGILIPVYAIHHDPDIYPNPEVFNPDRFTSDEVGKRHPMSFLPFGDGPRNCIGLRFGRMQARIGLINLLRYFRIKISNRTEVPLKFDNKARILTSKGGLYLAFEKI